MLSQTGWKNTSPSVRPPRPVHPVGEVPGVDHSHAAEPAAPDDPAHSLDRRIEAMGMADHELDAGSVGRLDHALRVFEADRHGLLGQHVLAGGNDQARMLGVKLGRRRDVHRVDFGFGQHRRQVGEALRAGLGRNALPDLGNRLGEGRKLEFGVITYRRQERAGRGPHSGNSNANSCGHGSVANPLLATLPARE